jgi:hypothetical protein
MFRWRGSDSYFIPGVRENRIFGVGASVGSE